MSPPLGFFVDEHGRLLSEPPYGTLVFIITASFREPEHKASCVSWNGDCLSHEMLELGEYFNSKEAALAEYHRRKDVQSHRLPWNPGSLPQ